MCLQENTICQPSYQTLFHNLHPASMKLSVHSVVDDVHRHTNFRQSSNLLSIYVFSKYFCLYEVLESSRVLRLIHI
jgi:hypothetical protein